MVYIPEKWKHLFPAKVGSRIDGFVSFVDFAPTVLHLAGIEVPKEMDGNPFLGKDIGLKEINKKNETFGHADRFDEKYDLVRSIRRGKFKYIRNYQPFNIDALYNAYRYHQKGYREWKELYNKGELNAEQAAFFEARPAEQLFDVETDPHEVKNLATDPIYSQKLKELRKALDNRVKTWPDLSFYPEPYLRKMAIDNPTAFGQKQQKEIKRLIEVSNLELLPFDVAKKDIAKALHSDNPWEKYWGVIVCSSFKEKANEFSTVIRQLKESDDEILVRLRAIEFLGLTKQENPVPALENLLSQEHTMLENLLILNTASLFKSLDESLSFQLDAKALIASANGDDNGEYWIGRRIAI